MKTKRIFYPGVQFGKLICIALKDRFRIKVRCVCGKEYITYKTNVKNNINGCLQCHNKLNPPPSPITHGKRKSKIYRVWSDMKTRCLNLNNIRFKDYGGRGINVCERWLKFENFYVDMGDVPVGMSIERIDNNKGYSKDNCKWATMKEQSKNKRITRNDKGHFQAL